MPTGAEIWAVAVLAKPEGVLYRFSMRSMARLILAFCLTIALIVGGIPFAHAMPAVAQDTATLASAPVAGPSHQHLHDGGHAIHHRMQHEFSADQENGASPQFPGNTADDLCKGLKCCSMCATAYVAPSLRPLTVDRVAFAVRYDPLVTAHPETMIFLDPGIPIA